MKNPHHVDHQVVHIHEHIFVRNRGVIFPIGVLALKPEIVGVISQIQSGHKLMQAIKGHRISIGRINGVRTGLRLQYIIV